MAGSKLFQDYQRAFATANGIALELRDVDSSPLATSVGKSGDSHCVRLGLGGNKCAACRFFQEKLAVMAQQSALSCECYAGLCETAVPVRTGNRVIALLWMAQIRLKAPTPEDVERVLQLACSEKRVFSTAQVRTELWQFRYISPDQYASLVQLLEFFSRQLTEWYGLHARSERPLEPEAILRAKEWIEAHYHEPLTLTKVATVAQMTPSHFCRIFHRSTGITFRLFLSRTRIAQVCKLLGDQRNSIAESALAVGFQSISQFNRTFHSQIGQSPSDYRAALFAGRSAPVRGGHPLAGGLVTKALGPLARQPAPVLS